MVEPECPLLPVSHPGRQVDHLVDGRVLQDEALLGQGQVSREQPRDRQGCTEPPGETTGRGRGDVGQHDRGRRRGCLS